ncbi:MAG: hypothetical protein J6Y66_00385 [Bacteroidales bacterium]|nr:hypothetical protein [Bacteroidales bacterium]
MGNKSTWIAIAAVALLIGGIAFGVTRLYGTGGGKKTDKATPAEWEILRAVPSDAVAVVVFDGSRAARKVIADSTGLLKPVIAADNPAIMGYLEQSGKYRTAVALMTSGALVPLVITQTNKADSAAVTQLTLAAQEAGLKAAVKENFLIASRSETFLGSSARHIDEGTSVLKAMGALPEAVKGAAVAFLSHSHAGKILQVYSTPPVRKQASFVKDLTAWSAWSIQEVEKDHIVIEGTALPGEAAASWFAAYQGSPAPQPEFPEALPYHASEVISVPITENFITSRKAFEDGRGRLSKVEKALKDKSGRDLTPAEWFSSLQPKEAVKVTFTADDGTQRSVVLLHSAKDLKLGTESPNPYRGTIGLILGEYFAITDTVCSQAASKWAVWGDLPSVRAFSKGDYTLKERMADASVPAPQGFAAYASLTDSPLTLDNLFAPSVADALKSWFSGSGYAPAMASLDLSGDLPKMKLEVYKRALRGTKVQVMERDTTVVVPTGLFPVTNFSTGQTNYLYQNSHLSICLNDENGKGVWGVPFKESLCGRVRDIDYFGNGKIQFLFCAGSKLWAIDRLGHWVNGFPADLGKPVLLGPDVYDFTGASGYTAMVLHKDNTLERYNLHGKRPDGWKGIKAPETVKNLPELIEAGERRFWAVRTSVRTIIYPFEGGDPAVNPESGKMIKPDSPLTVSGRSVKAECYDGKSREFKLY